MKAGKNTPESVLHYIDVIWAKNLPPDPAELARELGYGPKRYRVLKEKHGNRLLIHLRQVKRARTERLRFMAKQNGLLHPPQYVSSVEGAIDDAEVVPEEDQTLVTMQAHGKWAEYEETERSEEVAEQQAKQLTRKLRRLQADAAKLGIDITPRLVAMIREAEREIAEKRAA